MKLHRRQKSSLFLCMLILFVIPLSSPVHQSWFTNEITSDVDSSRILQRIEHLVSLGSRVSGSSGYNQSLDWIQTQLVQWGFQTWREPVWVSDLESNSHNLIALKQGNSSRIFGISAHLDSVSTRDENASAPGANDNGSGIGCLLELGFLSANLTFQDSLMLFFFTGEEQSFDGSTNWIENHNEEMMQFSIFINIDMVGVGSQLEIAWHLDIPSSEYSASLIEEARKKFQLPSVILSPVSSLSPWISSDQIPFWDSGIGAVLIKSSQAHLDEYYHTSQDLPSRLNQTLLADVTRLVLATLSIYGNGSFIDPPFIPIGLQTIINASFLVFVSLIVILIYRRLRSKRASSQQQILLDEV